MKNPRWQNIGVGFFLAGLWVSGGCSQGGQSPLPVTFASPRETLRTAAAAFLLGRAEDDLEDATHRRDHLGVRLALKKKQMYANPDFSPTQQAEDLVFQNTGIMQEMQLSSPQEREQLLKDALERYRSALELDPQLAKNSSNRRLLNDIGYFLADKGETKKDFQDAENLTRAAVMLWDKTLEELPPNSEDLRRAQAERALGPLDSMAWAIYKQGRYKEAGRYQEEVIRVMGLNSAEDYNRSEVIYHMGEIYRAQKQYQKAKEQFHAALNAEPDPSTRSNIEAALARLPAEFRRAERNPS